VRHQGGGIPLNRNHVFDSSGPDLRTRGTAQQLFERYLQLGRDATGSGDRVMAESYFQHAEHYFRILNAMNQAQQGQGGQGQGQSFPNGQHQPRRGGYPENGGGPGDGEGDDFDTQQQPMINDRGGDSLMQDGSNESRQIPIAASPPEG
jgi:hypothetical protein